MTRLIHSSRIMARSDRVRIARKYCVHFMAGDGFLCAFHCQKTPRRRPGAGFDREQTETNSSVNDGTTEGTNRLNPSAPWSRVRVLAADVLARVMRLSFLHRLVPPAPS